MPDLRDRIRPALEGRYEIERELGSGGMATVFLAHDSKYQREVAVKVLKPSLSEAMGPKRFHREVRITSNLNHPGILPMLDSGDADGLLYYVLPYVEGGSLRDQLNRETQLEVAEAVRITSELASALDMAHDQNVIHRDIKPENILLHEGRPILADFGIATFLDTTDPSTTTAKDLVMGTVAYMSPERCTGESRGERRSDVYALGCVAYEMLTGETPFTARTTTGLVARIISEPPRSIRVVRPAIAKKVERVILRALAKVPADRPRTAGKFAAEFTKAATERVNTPVARLVVATATITAVILGDKEIIDAMTGDDRDSWFPRTELAVRFAAMDSTESSIWFASALTRGVTRALSIGGAPGVRSGNALAAFPVDCSNSSVAQVLEIGTIVDGHVLTTDSAVILEVALVDTRTSRLLGDVSRDSVPVGQQSQLLDRVAEMIAGQLREQLGMILRIESMRANADNEYAWQLLQRAQTLRDRAFMQAERTRTVSLAYDLLERAESLLVHAHQADSDWGEPVLMRGFLEYDRIRVAEVSSIGSIDTTTVMEWIQQGQRFAEQVVDDNRYRAQALELLGQLRLREWQWSLEEMQSDFLQTVIADFQNAIELNENSAGSWIGLGNTYEALGQFDDFAHAMDRALEVDVWHEEVRLAHVHNVFSALRDRNVEEARSHCDFGRIHYPTNPLFLSCELDILGWTGNNAPSVARAWALLSQLESHDGVGELDNRWHYRRMLVAAIAARAGMHDSAMSILDNAETDPARTGSSRHWLGQKAHVVLLTGDTAHALHLLHDYLEANPQQRLLVSEHVWYEALHNHPEFLRMVNPEPDN